MKPFYVVVAPGGEVDKDLLTLALRVLSACGHRHAEVHVCVSP